MKDKLDVKFTEEAELSRGKLPVLERIVYDFVTDCRKSLANNEVVKFCNLVELFTASFPYETEKIKKSFAVLNRDFALQLYANNKTEGRKLDQSTMYLEFSMKKYHILTHLLKAKNMYPKPAEHEEF